VSGILEQGELAPAKAQSTPSSEGKDELTWGIFPTFATFASLREIFRVRGEIYET
jgi:hypothetical protein